MKYDTADFGTKLESDALSFGGSRVKKKTGKDYWSEESAGPRGQIHCAPKQASYEEITSRNSTNEDEPQE